MAFDLNDPAQNLQALEYQKKVVRIQRDARRAVAAEEAAQRPGPKLIFDGDEEWHALDYLIDGVIPAEGAGQLFGESDVGKTFVALSMSVAICGGLPWQGRAAVRGTVLFIEAEGGRSFALRKHAAKIEAGIEPTLERFPFITNHEALRFGPDTDEALAVTRAAAIRSEAVGRHLPPIRLVVADTLAQNIHGDADSNADMTAFLRLFRTFLKALSDEPVFGLLIHHPGHAEKTRGRGAYALPADLDLIMKLEGTPEALTLSCDRMRDDRRFAPFLLALEVRDFVMDDRRPVSTLVVVSGAEAGKAKPVASPRAQILRHLGLHPRQSTTQISEDLHIRKSTVVKEVDALCDEGLLTRIELKTGKTGQIKQVYEVAPDTKAEHSTETEVDREA